MRAGESHSLGPTWIHRAGRKWRVESWIGDVWNFTPVDDCSLVFEGLENGWLDQLFSNHLLSITQLWENFTHSRSDPLCCLHISYTLIDMHPCALPTKEHSVRMCQTLPFQKCNPILFRPLDACQKWGFGWLGVGLCGDLHFGDPKFNSFLIAVSSIIMIHSIHSKIHKTIHYTTDRVRLEHPG